MTTKRERTRNIDALLEILEAEPLDDSVVDAATVNLATANRMFTSVRTATERMSARFTGASTHAHELAVRPATRALLALQESVSAIGAALMDQQTNAGQISASIRHATELKMSPHVAPGSVVFTLGHGTEEQDGLIANNGRPLLDESFGVLLDLLDLLGPSNSDLEAVPNQLRRLGPRAAKHLFDLSAVLVDEDLGLDLGWSDREGGHRSAKVSPGGAGYLRNLAKKAVSTEVPVTFEGVLHTVSLDKQKLQLDSGDRIAMSASDDLQRSLVGFFNKRVRVTATETMTVNLSSGKETHRYEMRSVALIADDSAGDAETH